MRTEDVKLALRPAVAGCCFGGQISLAATIQRAGSRRVVPELRAHPDCGVNSSAGGERKVTVSLPCRRLVVLEWVEIIFRRYLAV